MMTDKERAEEALKAHGYVERRHNYWSMLRPDRSQLWKRVEFYDYSSGATEFRMSLWGTADELPTLLSPSQGISLEDVESEVMSVLWDAMAYPTEKDVTSYAKRVVARLQQKGDTCNG